MDFLAQKIVPSTSSFFVLEKHYTSALECMPIPSESLVVVSLKNYAH
jgi:hypothetical protein